VLFKLFDEFAAPAGAKILSIAPRATAGEKIIWGFLNDHQRQDTDFR
jgi:hypothetical protein